MKPDDSQIEKSLFERSAELLEEMGVDCHWELTRFRAKLSLDLSRICAAPSARLGHFPFEGDRALPAQC